jgi:hypothetical protein
MAHLKIVDLGSSELLTLESNIFSLLLPSYLFSLEALLRIQIRLHASCKQAFILLKVTNIYLIFEQFLPSLHLEVEPLQVASCVTIDPHEAVVLSFPHSNYTVKVAALEEGIEEEVIFGLPVLPAEGTVGELHVIGGLDVVVGEAEGLIIPRVVGVLVSRP